MILDFNSKASSVPKEADVVILGGGPAGIVAALEIARRRPEWRIVLLEGGGETVAESRNADLYEGSVSGRNYVLAASRMRLLGGSSNHWGGWVRPLTAGAMSQRSGMQLPAWPFGPEELAPYLDAAMTWCEVRGDFDAAALASQAPGTLIEFPSDSAFTNALFRFSPPTRFGKRYRDTLEQTPGLSCVTHANAISLGLESGEVRHVEFAAVDGPRATISAGHVICAMGGLENPRFLLNQRGEDVTDSALDSELLGACFADHFGRTLGMVHAPARLAYPRHADPGGDAVMGVITPTDQAVVDTQGRTAAFTLTPETRPGLLGRRYLATPSRGEMWNYRLAAICEQFADPESRVRLSDARDALGLRKLDLAWRYSRADTDSVYDWTRRLAVEFGEAGIGRVQLSLDPTGEPAREGGVGWHHMGTTRMAATAQHGIVDADCRVHGFRNLWIAGSSVFPSYGFSNPTLTIVKLAIRLSARITETSGLPT